MGVTSLIIVSMNKFEEIKKIIDSHPIVLFMKGTKAEPKCGFSSMVVQALIVLGVQDFHHVDILQDSQMRQDIKEFTDWPTLPQLYIKGEFVGGADIVQELLRSGELKTLLEDKGLV